MAPVFHVDSLKRQGGPFEVRRRNDQGSGVRWHGSQWIDELKAEPTPYHPRWAVIQLCITLALWFGLIVGVRFLVISL